jgi:hypothetical protein
MLLLPSRFVATTDEALCPACTLPGSVTFLASLGAPGFCACGRNGFCTARAAE